MECTESDGFFSIRAGWLCIVGLLLHVVSFLLYMGLISKFDLSYLAPVITGVVYILTLLLSVTILGEKRQLHQILASVLILAGVIIMNKKGGFDLRHAVLYLSNLEACHAQDFRCHYRL